jgi:hypothetical protein
MQRLNQLPLVACFLGLASVAGVFLAVGSWRKPPALSTSQPVGFPERWDCRDLVGHLHASGLQFRAVSTSEHGPDDRSVYLTKTEKTWVELNGMLKAMERRDDWRGTVYCEKTAFPSQQDTRMGLWGDCCLCLGHFILFGDPAMLVEIGQALARNPPPPTYQAALAK